MTDLPVLHHLRIEARPGGVVVVELHRPDKLNALNRALVGELRAAIAALSVQSPTVLILTGAGQRAFAAGADIGEMVDLGPEQALAFAREGQAALGALESFPAPTIAAVRGFALGGGCELAMACDLVLAAPTAVFGQPEVRLGVIPGFGGTIRLARRVGRQRALELMMTGRNVPADEAVRIGLALQVAEDDVLEAALALAARVGAQGPGAVRALREVVRAADPTADAPRMEAEARAFALCFASDEQKEGMRAFLERRPPRFAAG